EAIDSTKHTAAHKGQCILGVALRWGMALSVSTQGRCCCESVLSATMFVAFSNSVFTFELSGKRCKWSNWSSRHCIVSCRIRIHSLSARQTEQINLVVHGPGAICMLPNRYAPGQHVKLLLQCEHLSPVDMC